MSATKTRLVAAFAVIYVVWGSTYLAIRIALEAWPPFLLAGTRFLVAGACLLWLARRAGAGWPDSRQWRSSAATGALLFLGGNGLVCWAEQEVASGLAALALATVPVWMTLLPAPAALRRRVGPSTWAGVGLGLAAVAWLAAPARALEKGVPAGPLLALLGAAASWSIGSHLTLRLPHSSSPFATAGAQMLCGGLAATLVGTLSGEWRAVEPSGFTRAGLGAWIYLVVFGSVLAVSAYGWLLRHASPAAVGTYAFVNPIVAVGLGGALGGEVLGPRTLGSLVLVVVSVALVLHGRTPRPVPAGRRRRRLGVAALLGLLALAPLGSKAAIRAVAREACGTSPAPSVSGRRSGPAAIAADRSSRLAALGRIARDRAAGWRKRLAAAAELLRSPEGRGLLLALELRRGPLVIETPARILVFRLLDPPRASAREL